MRSIVSFSTDSDETFKASEPPGFEIAKEIKESLSNSGIQVDGPKNREGWAWNFLIQRDGYQLEAILGYTDDSDVNWLITTHTHTHISFLKKIFGSNEIKKESLSELNKICNEINACLTRKSFKNIRWFNEKDFDNNDLSKWSDYP